MTTDTDESQWPAALAAGLKSVPRSARRDQDLRSRLLDRVRSSAAAHRDYLTVRRDDGAWLATVPGVRQRMLRSDRGLRVEVVRLAPGSTLPWPDDAVAQELLLLEGALSAADGAGSPAGLPGAAGYRVRQRQPADAPLVAGADSTVYVRHLLVDRAALPALEAHWWDLACAAPAWIDPGRRRWHASADGVDVLPLRGDGDVVSMLVRFAPGASVPDHGHALDEDCLVLRGEMFLGDILLRAGDYQLAPAGGSHFGEISDVGVLFFFHGALDPVLRGVRPAAG